MTLGVLIQTITTFQKMTLSITKLSIMTLRITTFGIMTFSKIFSTMATNKMSLSIMIA
jgi:hypothetical protein